MQRTHRAAVLETNFTWDDIGSFTALERFLKGDEKGNIITGCESGLLDVENTTVMGDKRLIAAIGLKDMLIIDTKDVVLVCPKDRCQDIKDLVKDMNGVNGYEKFM
ncbi:MAG TPA: hypothetical protein DDX02_02015 [Clostridiaceae bacterium]|nr:hypothetical protein [Clostridiaceae bacterium]